MSSATRCLSGAALAAAAMYWFDPTSGRRRRARLRDRATSLMKDTRHGVDVGTRDLAHRVGGIAAEARHLFDSAEIDDGVLGERVRACLGRAVSHPGAVEIETRGGRVVLRGAVLAHEYPQLMDCVRGVRGVRSVEDQLGVHADSRGVSALQGGRPRSHRRIDLLQESWSPATRLLITAAGGALALGGLRRGGALGTLAVATGVLSIVRSTSNVPLRRLAGAAGRRAIDVRKTIQINAPLERVYQTLARLEDYPLFMHNVRSVRLLTDERSHWTAVGPAGVAIEWDAEVSALEQNRLIAWRTLRNSPIQHAGLMRFEPAIDGTRLDIRMSYNPPGGALGHYLARLLGADPKRQLDEALVRVKTYIETGRVPRDAARRVRRAARGIGESAPTLTPAEGQ
ncbi:MAG: SRPBCC family protein [Steroidobacteraceae bacterium]